VARNGASSAASSRPSSVARTRPSSECSGLSNTPAARCLQRELPSPPSKEADAEPAAATDVMEAADGNDVTSVAKFDLDYSGLVASGRPPRPRTPGSDIGGQLRRHTVRSSSGMSDEGSCCTVKVDLSTPNSPVAVALDVDTSGTGGFSIRVGRGHNGGSSQNSGSDGRTSSRHQAEDVPSLGADNSLPGSAEDTCEAAAAAPEAFAPSQKSEIAVTLPLAHRRLSEDVLGSCRPSSARSDVAARGTPTSGELGELNACYAEVMQGCLGWKPAEWLAEQLWDGQPPAAEQLKACVAFSKYDRDGDGKLSLLELGTMLREQGQKLDYASAERAMELAAGGGKELSLEGFLKIMEQHAARSCGYSEHAKDLLSNIFKAYDSNFTGSLEVLEISALLSDMGRAPMSRQEAEDMKHLISECRQDGVAGPLRFDEFLHFARRLDDLDASAAAQNGEVVPETSFLREL